MIALLGGTFDPIHNGHLYIAREVCAAFSARQVIFIPSKEPPHRDTPAASGEQRAAMVKYAIADHDTFQFSNIELERPGPSYTIDTVKTITKYFPHDELGLILGSDAFQQFTTWLHWEEILEYCRLIVINRDGTTTAQDAIDPSHIRSLAITPCPISASQIRQAVANRQPIDALVPKAVNDYIIEHKLYL